MVSSLPGYNGRVSQCVHYIDFLMPGCRQIANNSHEARKLPQIRATSSSSTLEVILATCCSKGGATQQLNGLQVPSRRVLLFVKADGFFAKLCTRLYQKLIKLVVCTLRLCWESGGPKGEG